MPDAPATITYSVPKPADHPVVGVEKTGVMLINLGTPDATSYWPMRRYLNQFLSDKRVIDYPSWFWQPLLQGIILTTRPKKSGAAYASIWNREKDESPLRTLTREQCEALTARLSDCTDLVVDWGMRYGQPSVPDVLQKMFDAGCRRVLLMALYPQYSATTTATAYDEAFRKLLEMRWQPQIRTVGPWHDDPLYIEALATSVEDHLATLDWEPEVVITSFHGLPERYLKAGDPYHCHCAKTNRLLRERLGWPKDKLKVCFQSRFGSEPWLQPYLDETVEHLAKEGVKRLAVISPAFVADCVETLEEIDQEVRDEFLENGGEQFTYIPCLNANEPGMKVIETIVRRELAGWIG
ncbi:MAG: ferrochelatase [Geminicoccaceae bacterium]|nr:MAG: ferrochelatase [Geminicoccaceae bacterium]